MEVDEGVPKVFKQEFLKKEPNTKNEQMPERTRESNPSK